MKNKDKSSPMTRRDITFEQAEGMAPMPSQLRPGEITAELRALLWAIVYKSIEGSMAGMMVSGRWETILKDKWVVRDHRPLDTFNGYIENVTQNLKMTFFSDHWAAVFGLVEFIIRHPQCPSGLPAQFDQALRKSRSAYVIYDGDTIGPLASDQEAAAIEGAFEAAQGGKFFGANTHLKNAINALNRGDAAGSVRESISAVESVALVIAPKSNGLGPALSAIEKKHRIHGALSEGFKKLYGFTSDEKGIRHALLDEGAAKVDDADALYMLGACASFVTYLISRTS